MKMILVFLVLAVLGLVGWKMYKGMPLVPQSLQAAMPEEKRNYTVSTSEKASERRIERQAVFREAFIAVSKAIIMTDQDNYIVGELCKKGRVVKMDERAVYIRGFDSMPVLVVHDQERAAQRRKNLGK